MSCIKDIYESFKDLCVDCIFCKEENRERISKRYNRCNKKRHNKSTQTEMDNLDNESIIEPGSIIN